MSCNTSVKGADLHCVPSFRCPYLQTTCESAGSGLTLLGEVFDMPFPFSSNNPQKKSATPPKKPLKVEDTFSLPVMFAILGLMYV